MFSQLLTCILQTSTNIRSYNPDGWLDQLDESLKPFANRPQHLQGCIQIQSLLGAASNIKNLHPHCIGYMEPPTKNTLTPPLPTEESHRSCSRIAQCGRQKFDDNALKKQEGGSISTTTIELQSRQRRTCKCLVCRALMVLFS